ncbi:MAG: HEAT repeat domain-containing protein [Phycisphaerae bacterium]|jgi:HEAT repeat protein|nr:HEAT repeat domain-containing protein [Phycisphaerae bacterium]
MNARQRAVTAIVLGLAVVMMVSGPLRAADHTKIIGYKFGASRVELAAIEDEIRKTKDTKAIETELLKALNSPKATFECKQFVCRMLRRIGTDASVSSLAKLLTDEKLSNMARFALQGMAGATVDQVLRDALGKTAGPVRVGMIGTIAARGDKKAVPALSKLLADKDADTARAAIAALGKIGGADAAKALDGATVSKDLQAVADDAALSCAETLAAAGDTKTAAAIYKKLFANDKSTAVRIAALGGIARTDKTNAAPIIASLLSGKDLTMQRLAAKLINEVSGTDATKVFAGKLPTLPGDVQVIVITALSSRGDKAASAAVTKAASSQDPAVRAAALEALGSLGDASSVNILTEALAAGGSAANAAGGSLTRLRGDGVGGAIVKGLASDNKSVRASLLKILAARREKDATAAVLKAAGSDKESEVRRAAFKALGTLGAQSDVPKMASLLVSSESSSDRAGLANAILQVSERCDDADVRSAPLISALGKADDKAKSVLLVVLSRLAGDKAYAAIKGQLASGSDDVKKASVRALAAWPDATPAAALLSVAKSDSDKARQVLAMRGYIRVVTIVGDEKPTAAVCKAKTDLLAKGLKVATGTPEKTQILAALTNFPCADGLTVAQGCTSDNALAKEAKLAVSKIKWALAHPSAKASASTAGDKAALALDSNRKTIWSTGRAMKSGDSFTLALAKNDKIAGVTLDCGDKLDDYPRTYEVFVSADGKAWGSAVATGKGRRGITTISFRGIGGSYIKIVQTGTSERKDRRGRKYSNPWSIAEISVAFE